MSYSRNWHFLPRSKLCFASGVAIFLFNEKILEKTFCEKSAIMIFMKTDDKLAHIRHSLAHLLAAAVLELYPNTKPTLGPAIENGFYYDFEFGTPISDKDLPSIEKKMREILKTWETFHGIEVSANEARDIFSDNPYKTELINEIASRNEKITLYYSGPKSGIPSLSSLQTTNYKLASWTCAAAATWRIPQKISIPTHSSSPISPEHIGEEMKKIKC